MKKVVLAAAIAAISSGALAQTSIPVNVSGLVVPVATAPEVPEEEKNCTVGSEGESVDLPFNDVEKGSAATSESDFINVSDCSGATVSLSTTEGDTQTSTIDGRIGSTETAIALAANVAGSGGNLFEQSAEVDSDSTEIEVTASLTAEQTSQEGAVVAAGMIYVTIDGQDTPAPAPEPTPEPAPEPTPEERANAVLGELAGNFPAEEFEARQAELESNAATVKSGIEGRVADGVSELEAAGTQLEEASEPVQSGISNASTAIQSAAAALEGAPQAIQSGVEGVPAAIESTLADFQGQAPDLAKQLEAATMPVLSGLEGADPQAFVEKTIGDATQQIPTPPPSNGGEPSEQFQAALNEVIADAAQNIPTPPPSNGGEPSEQFAAALGSIATQAAPIAEGAEATATNLQARGTALAEAGEARLEQVPATLQAGATNIQARAANLQASAANLQARGAALAEAGEARLEQVPATLQAGATNIQARAANLQASAANLQARGAALAEAGEARLEPVTTSLQERGDDVMQQGEENQGDAESSIADFLTVEVSEEFDMGEVALETDFLDLSAGVITQR